MNLLPPLDKLKPLSGAPLREKAFNYVSEKGLPTRKDEDWRYTSLKALNDGGFTSAISQPVLPSHDTLKFVSTQLGEWSYNVVFVNGVLDRTLSAMDDLPNLISWSEGAGVTGFVDTMEALNVATMGQGLTLKVKDGALLDKPLRVHFHTSLEGGSPLMVSPRLNLQVGDRAEATIVESYSGAASAKYFVNAHTEVAIGAGAKVNYVRAQDESREALHVGRTRLHPGAHSELVTLVSALGAKLNRHTLELVLESSEIKAKVLGLVAGTGDQHADNMTDIDHRVGGCTTEQVYKSLLGGKSRSVFSGRIRIRPNAQKANSDQLSKNLLLSSEAEADARPQLMIEADDVKATHGTTVGQLSADELFYLMSRGLSREKAVPLLAAGFLADLVHEIPNEATKTWMLERLDQVLADFKLEAL